MIQIKIEEAEAFDRLSILSIKLKNVTDLDIAVSLKEQIRSLEEEVSIKIGRDLADKIYKSEEYKNLLFANISVFNGVSLAKENKISAKDLDFLNNERFAAKKAIQEKFFGKKLNEVKV